MQLKNNGYKNLKVTNFTCNGVCSNCGGCCGDILHLSKMEIKKIEKFLKEHKINATPRNILVDYDNTCPFRDNKEKKCKIYEVRPEICRAFMCNKTPAEAYWNRELTNEGKLPRSMRQLFFKDNDGAKWIKKFLNVQVYDKKDRMVK